MPFGYSDKIFPYPAVHYIPLQIYEGEIKKNPYINRGVRIKIYLPGQSIPGKQNQIIPHNRLALQIYNGEVDIIKYRGHEITMVGKENPGFYHSFFITNRYFYKKNLIFVLYNGKTAQKMARKTLTI